MRGGPKQKYEALVDAGEIDFDPAQADAANALQALQDRLAKRPEPSLIDRLNPFAKKPDPIPGLYIWGPVGRGKTMLMNLFFESVHGEKKRRVHFQEFMSEAHDEIEKARQRSEQQAVRAAASELAKNLTLLCLDELEITDIADAMVVGRLFRTLFDKNVTIVATSNTAPKDLYKGGLNRQLFLPFIEVIRKRMEVQPLESEKDYRLERLAGSDLYLTPADEAARASLDKSWQKLTGRQEGEEETLTVKGREIRVPQAALGVARFPFGDLCEQPLGPLDYQRIARSYHTVIVDGIPVLGPEQQNVARRLTTLVDALYDHGVGLIASAEASPDSLYQGHNPDSFARTASRLMEMRSVDYLKSRHTGLEVETAEQPTSEDA
ncbi:AFG1-like ATPase [Methyloligella halotolerans]|uniref:AFG1-like ATPase n=1 Tax=Methyloligella halotolerans TaxID=1177755 RepID=A0A1E2S130_9HYPH|nr:cell division protein ZapE [Methyloligella halotolerans]ODA68164.1 AFG1-like ATPase [Methyloligella halotolerans]